MSRKIKSSTLLLGVIYAASTTAFSPIPSLSTTASKNNSGLIRPQTKLSSTQPKNDIELQSYGEQSRKYRRTVFTHEDWVKHRSPGRFFYNLKSILKSGIYSNLSEEVTLIVGSACALIAWNCLFGEYQDLAGVTHPGPLSGTIFPCLALPITPFTLSSPSLGLLLGKCLR